MKADHTFRVRVRKTLHLKLLLLGTMGQVLATSQLGTPFQSHGLYFRCEASNNIAKDETTQRVGNGWGARAGTAEVRFNGNQATHKSKQDVGNY